MATIEAPVEERLTRLESDMGHVRSVVGDIKLGIRELRVSRIWTVTVAATAA